MFVCVDCTVYITLTLGAIITIMTGMPAISLAMLMCSSIVPDHQSQTGLIIAGVYKYKCKASQTLITSDKLSLAINRVLVKYNI